MFDICMSERYEIKPKRSKREYILTITYTSRGWRHTTDENEHQRNEGEVRDKAARMQHLTNENTKQRETST